MLRRMRSLGGSSDATGTKGCPVIFSYSRMYRRDSSATSSAGAAGRTCKGGGRGPRPAVSAGSHLHLPLASP